MRKVLHAVGIAGRQGRAMGHVEGRVGRGPGRPDRCVVEGAARDVGQAGGRARGPGGQAGSGTGSRHGRYVGT